MANLVLLNNFMHDFSAAGWIFGAVVLYVLMRNELPEGKAGITIIDAVKSVIFLDRLSFIGIVIFGIIRTLAYKSYEWNTEAGDGQVTLIIIKHIILTVVFLVGLYFYIKAVRFVKNSQIEAE